MDPRQHYEVSSIYPSAPPMTIFSEVPRMEAQLHHTSTNERQRFPNWLMLLLIVSLVFNLALLSCISMYVYINYLDNNMQIGKSGETTQTIMQNLKTGWPCNVDFSEAVCLACNNFRPYDFWQNRVKKMITGNTEMCCTKMLKSLTILSNLFLNSKKRLFLPMKSETVEWQFAKMSTTHIKGSPAIVPLNNNNNYIQINRTGLYHVEFLSTLKLKTKMDRSPVKVQVMKDNANSSLTTIMEQTKEFYRTKTIAYQTVSLENTFRLRIGDMISVMVSDASKVHKDEKYTWLGVYQL